MIKKLVKKILYKTIWPIRKSWFLHSSDFADFKKSRKTKKIILLDTPTHANLGDHAIALAEHKFMEQEFPNVPVFEFTQREYCYASNHISKYLTENDVLVVHGGGFIGTLWLHEEMVFLQILKEFKNHKIIVFPQTVYFEDSDKGREELSKLQTTFSLCKNITLFLRDEHSYQYAKENLSSSSIKHFLVPDIVTYLKCNIKEERENIVLKCIRRDEEIVKNDSSLEWLEQYFEQHKLILRSTDTVINKDVNKKERELVVYDKLIEFARAKIVVTDRLHGMLFAAITGTPCIAMDNISKKVSGAYKWLEGLGYIKFVNQVDENVLDRLLSIQNGRYRNAEFIQYYAQIKEAMLRED